MKRSLLLSLVICIVISACYTVPITDRKQVNLLPEIYLMEMSLTSYKQFLSDNKVIQNSNKAAMVKRVGNRMSAAIETYLNSNGHGKRVKNYKWEFWLN